MSRDDGHRLDVPDERKKAFGERYQPRYSGVATFMRRPLREESSQWEGIDIGIVGVPFDGGVTNRPGARHGPRHLREQSTLMGVVNHQTGVRPHDLAESADLGDVLIEGVYRLDEAIADIERHYDRIAAAGIVPLTAGGDHSITLPIMRALAGPTADPLASSTSMPTATPDPSGSGTSTTMADRSRWRWRTARSTRDAPSRSASADPPSRCGGSATSRA